MKSVLNILLLPLFNMNRRSSVFVDLVFHQVGTIEVTYLQFTLRVCHPIRQVHTTWNKMANFVRAICNQPVGVKRYIGTFRGEAGCCRSCWRWSNLCKTSNEAEKNCQLLLLHLDFDEVQVDWRIICKAKVSFTGLVLQSDVEDTSVLYKIVVFR